MLLGKGKSMESAHQVQQSASHVGGFLAGLLLGGLIGAVAMLLMAPRSGIKTRENLQHKGEELRDQVTESVDDAMAQARDKTKQIKISVRKEADHLKKMGKDVLDDQMHNVNDIVDNVKSAVQSS